MFLPMELAVLFCLSFCLLGLVQLSYLSPVPWIVMDFDDLCFLLAFLESLSCSKLQVWFYLVEKLTRMIVTHSLIN